MTDCVGRLDLVRWEASPELERAPEIGAHIKTCEACAAALAEIGSARQELLGDAPEVQSQIAARAIVARMAERRRRSWWRLFLPLTLTPLAAGATLLIIVSQGVFSPPTSHSSLGKGGAVRSKGGLVIEAFCKRDDRIFPVKDGDDFVVGDRLRFAYTKDLPGILAVFGVDDSGRVFPYYRDDALAGINIPPGAEVMLPESVELDDHHGWERIFAVWTADPLGEDAIRNAVAAAMAGAQGDIRQAARLPLEADQVSFLLRRP
jgi:hypothetical protein